MKNRKKSDPLVPPENVRRRYADLLPPTDLLAMETLFALRSGVQIVENGLARWLGEDALTPGRLQVLVVLWSHREPVPQRELVQTLKVSRATISGLVEALANEGLVETSSDALDGRKVLVSLTLPAREMTQRLITENASRLRGTFHSLNDRELRTLIALLSRLH